MSIHLLLGIALQAEGGFVQGLGFYLSEGVVYDTDTGRVLTASPWHYPIPTASSIPRVFNVEFLPVSWIWFAASTISP